MKMTPLVIFAFASINLALIFYSIGVWAEKISGRLKPWHLVFFWLGIISDTMGTGAMLEFAGGITFDLHGISGLTALTFMLIHALWATYTLKMNNEKMIVKFHRFSLFVWIVWLIPYFSPMIFKLRHSPF